MGYKDQARNFKMEHLTNQLWRFLEIEAISLGYYVEKTLHLFRLTSSKQWLIRKENILFKTRRQPRWSNLKQKTNLDRKKNKCLLLQEIAVTTLSSIGKWFLLTLLAICRCNFPFCSSCRRKKETKIRVITAILFSHLFSQATEE